MIQFGVYSLSKYTYIDIKIKAYSNQILHYRTNFAGDSSHSLLEEENDSEIAASIVIW